MFKLLKIIVPLLFIVGCSIKPSIEDAKLSDRNFSLEEFFEGETRAYGQFQDILGNVSRRFLVDIKGSWDGSNLVLIEDFTYEDGSEELYDHETDPNEWTNLADQKEFAEIKQRLAEVIPKEQHPGLMAQDWFDRFQSSSAGSVGRKKRTKGDKAGSAASGK